MVSESQPPTAQLRLQHAVLFAQERDPVVLHPVSPMQNPDKARERYHWRILRPRRSIHLWDSTPIDAGSGHYGRRSLSSNTKVLLRQPAFQESVFCTQVRIKKVK
jgi:hypothetical protein